MKGFKLIRCCIFGIMLLAGVDMILALEWNLTTQLFNIYLVYGALFAVLGSIGLSLEIDFKKWRLFNRSVEKVKE